MTKVVQDFWIITHAGKVLFKRVFNVKMHAQLFGALLSALTSFSKEITNSGLTNFQSSSYKFTILNLYYSKLYNRKEFKIFISLKYSLPNSWY